MGIGDIQVQSATFIGRRGTDVITFACLVGGGYAVLRNGRAEGVFGPRDMAYAIQIHLRMVDRPFRTPRLEHRLAGNPPAPANPTAGARAAAPGSPPAAAPAVANGGAAA